MNRPGPTAPLRVVWSHSIGRRLAARILDWSMTSYFGGSMATVTAFDAKTRFGELLDRVANGEEIVITRHEKPVARMVPEGGRRKDDVRRAVAGLRDLQDR